MGKVISITNYKGGVGKTTTAGNLAVALSHRRKKVLLIDLDAQCNLTSLFVIPDELNQRTMFDAFIDRKELPVMKIRNGLDLSPSSVHLTSIEKALTDLIHNEDKELVILRNLIQPVRDYYDYILIDCPPSLGQMTKNALIASDGVIITLTAEALPYDAINKLITTIKNTRETMNGNLILYGILITRYNRRRINRLLEEDLRSKWENLVFTTKIRENVDIMEAQLYRKDIFEYSPDSIGAADYNDLANEIINR